MAKCKRVLRCYHCGSILQKDNPKEKGYISPEAFERPSPIQILYCDHCFENMKAFNNSVLDTQISDDIVKILDDAVASDSLILWIVDMFAFNGTLNPEVAKKVKSLNVAVIGNKMDLFKDKYNEEGVKEYIRERFQAYGIDPIDIRLLSNSPKTDYPQLLKDLHVSRKGHDVYMIGRTSSGKTTLVNKMLKFYTNKTTRPIKTITWEGTDSEVFEVPLTKSSFFYELPDYSNSTNVANIVEKDVQKIITPKKEVKIHLRTLMPGSSLAVGSLAEFALTGGKATPLKLYAAEGVELKTVQTKHADVFFQENLIKKSVRPVSDRYTKFTDFDIFEFSMEKDGRYHDIGIEGLCWISFKAQGQKIRVQCPKGTAVKECLSKFR